MRAEIVGTVRVRYSAGTNVARVLKRGVTASNTASPESAALSAVRKVWGDTVSLGRPVFIRSTIEFPVHPVIGGAR